MFSSPTIAVNHSPLEAEATRLGKLIALSARRGEKLLRTYREEILERQYQQARIADAAIELYTSACVLRRMDQLLGDPSSPQRELDLVAGRYYLTTADRAIRQNLANLWSNDDSETTALADLLLRGAG